MSLPDRYNPYNFNEFLVAALSEEITELVSHSNLFSMDEKTIEVCRRWDAFCHRLFHSYQDLALQEAEN